MSRRKGSLFQRLLSLKGLFVVLACLAVVVTFTGSYALAARGGITVATRAAITAATMLAAAATQATMAAATTPATATTAA